MALIFTISRMATFTLPFELRVLAKPNRPLIYLLLFQCPISTLKYFGRNQKGFHAKVAILAVQHTYTRLPKKVGRQWIRFTRHQIPFTLFI
jgi:hypothetical protein